MKKSEKHNTVAKKMAEQIKYVEKKFLAEDEHEIMKITHINRDKEVTYVEKQCTTVGCKCLSVVTIGNERASHYKKVVDRSIIEKKINFK